jgi:hypothetical protein
MQKLDHNIRFNKKHQLFAENRQKSLKSLIITLAPRKHYVIGLQR